MPDMLVRLYDIKDEPEIYTELHRQGILIKRVLAPDRKAAVDFVRASFNESWAGECECAFSNNPVTCYIAVKNKEIIGFACYEATARNFFGPTGVKQPERGKGVGKALLLKCMLSMYESGYAYAIIGGVAETRGFYEKAVNAEVIEGSVPGIYERMISCE